MSISIGDSASLTKTFTKEDVQKFADISLDNNPVHLDEDYARSTIFERPIVQGILTTGLISAVLANKLPGEGSVYMGQELKFKRPVYIGDSITAKVTVEEIKEEKQIYTLSTICTNQKDEVVISGEAVIKLLS